MTYWNSRGMSQCCSALQESEKRLRKIADEYMAEGKNGNAGASEKKLLMELAGDILSLANLEASFLESIPAIEKIYVRNEQKIADYFDLVVQRVPHTELGTSTMASLKEHEEQMPFERRSE